MPPSPKQKQLTREKIIRSARSLFNRHGLSAVSIDQIMAACGMTRGGFYRHFRSKEDLYVEAILAFGNLDKPARWQSSQIDFSARGAELARLIVGAYLSREHFDDRRDSCPMIALPSDVSRATKRVKVAFERILEMMVFAFADGLKGGEAVKRDQALVLASVCVGAMVLSRSVGSNKLADQLRDSARQYLLDNMQWNER